MIKLLSANFARLRRDKIFWVTLVGVFLISVATICSNAGSSEVMEAAGLAPVLEDFYFTMAPYMGLVYAGFISLFLGTEYSDGTMRNKLVVGHTRAHVYLANFLVCLAACLLFMGAWLIGCVPGRFLIGPFAMGTGGFLTYLLIAAGFTAGFAALFTLVASMSVNRALTVVISLGIWMVLVVAASGLSDRLNVPEMTGGMTYINGEFVMVGPTPDPLYLRGWARTLCEGILDLLPTGPSLLMHDASVRRPVREIVFSCLFTAAVTLSGVLSFRRKDLK